jgi:hypothetical protein
LPGHEICDIMKNIPAWKKGKNPLPGLQERGQDDYNSRRRTAAKRRRRP